MRRILLLALAAPLIAGAPVFADDASHDRAVLTAPEGKTPDESVDAAGCLPGLGGDELSGIAAQCPWLSSDHPLIAAIPSDEESSEPSRDGTDSADRGDVDTPQRSEPVEPEPEAAPTAG